MGPEFTAGDRVDAGSRFVKEKYRRAVHDRAGQRQALPVAERQITGRTIQEAAQIEGGDHLVDPLLPDFPGQPIDPSRKFQVLTH